MSRVSVLAAAAALQDFTIAQLASYCTEDPPASVRILAETGGLVERARSEEWPEEPLGAQRWHVVDPNGLRDLIAATPSESPPARVRRRDRPSGDDLTVRLLRAEETLLECAQEQSPEERRLMARTAMNYLRQFVAEHASVRNWWDVKFDDEQVGAVPDVASRVRVDAGLASMTASEATGRHVSSDSLIRTATQVCEMTCSMDSLRVRDLVDRFLELAGLLARHMVDETFGGGAPVRLLSALGWRRIRAQVKPDVARASHEAVSMLRWIESGSAAPWVDAPCLYQFLEHLPDGRNKIAVYSDLLAIVPRQYHWQPSTELVPGVLVEALADSPAACHLERCANTLEADLVHAPYRSDSALIGTVVHVFQDLATQAAEVDTGVVPRSDETRRELLSLVDIRVPTASAASELGRVAPRALSGGA